MLYYLPPLLGLRFYYHYLYVPPRSIHTAARTLPFRHVLPPCLPFAAFTWCPRHFTTYHRLVLPACTHTHLRVALHATAGCCHICIVLYYVHALPYLAAWTGLRDEQLRRRTREPYCNTLPVYHGWLECVGVRLFVPVVVLLCVTDLLCLWFTTFAACVLLNVGLFYLPTLLPLTLFTV